MVHSQGGGFADAAVGLRPDLIKMMIHLESNCRFGTPFTQSQIDGYKQVPSVLYVHGDNVVGNPASTGQPRLTFCTSDMNTINAAGGHATLVQLPDVGIRGNESHADAGQEQPSARGLAHRTDHEERSLVSSGYNPANERRGLRAPSFR